VHSRNYRPKERKTLTAVGLDQNFHNFIKVARLHTCG
jgi:hypothetical protein